GDEVLTEFYEPFRQSLEVAKSKMQSVKGVETQEKCPQCQRPLVVRYSKKTGSKFLGCSGYPECNYIQSANGDARPVATPTEHLCPTCNKPMVQRMGSRGPCLGCNRYPECRTTIDLDNQGNPVLASRPSERGGDKCGRPMV